MPKKYRVTLSTDERADLEGLLARGKADVRRLKHAQILLKADEADDGPAWSDERIADALNAGTATVERVRQRFVEEGLTSALSPYRGGTRIYERKLDGAQEAPLPFADTQAMQLHLGEISRTVARGAHAVLLLDRAGWHTTSNLVVPKNLTLIFLPSRAPELNPVENVWQYLRQNWLSNRVFDTYEAILDAACEAWRKLLAQPQAITSIGLRDWAHVGQK